MEVFLLWHVHEGPDGDENAKLIGVYSCREKAEKARQHVATQPGFREFLKGFRVDMYHLDQDQWAEGYIVQSPDETDGGA